MLAGHPLPGALGDDEEHRVDGGGAGRHFPAAGPHGEGTGGDGTEVSGTAAGPGAELYRTRVGVHSSALC